MSYLSQFHHQILGQIPVGHSAPKLVFLHGLMGFGSNWKSIARQFEDKYQILLYDQRGHGRSFQPDEGYRTANYAEDLKKILDELGWENVHLVGHSMGGRVAVEFAYLYPDLVQKLVIVDIGPQSDVKTMNSTLEKIQSVPVPFASRNEARDYFDGPFLQKYKDPMVKQFFYANLTQKENGQMDWRFSLPAIEETLLAARDDNQWVQFESLKGKSLLLRGEKSSDLSRSLFEQILESNPHIEGKEVSGAGHWLHVEKPKETISILKDFLK